MTHKDKDKEPPVEVERIPGDNRSGGTGRPPPPSSPPVAPPGG